MGTQKNMADETIRRWCHNEMRASVDSEIHRRAKAILALIDNAVAPPWLADAAVALGKVRPSDDAPLALNWNQVLQEIRELVAERDKYHRQAQDTEKQAARVAGKEGALKNPYEQADVQCSHWDGCGKVHAACAWEAGRAAGFAEGVEASAKECEETDTVEATGRMGNYYAQLGDAVETRRACAAAIRAIKRGGNPYAVQASDHSASCP